MEDERRKRDWPIVVAVVAALVLIPLGLYFGGYFLLAETEETRIPILTEALAAPPLHVEVRVRTFDAQWLTSMYEPLGEVEQSITGRNVVIQSEDELPSLGP